MCLARYASVIPLSFLINFAKRREAIPKKHQYMIVFAGIRGAIAFALSFEMRGASSGMIQTTILVVCVISILILGSLTPKAVEYFQIERGANYTSEADPILESVNNDLSPDEEADLAPGNEAISHWFIDFDCKYIKPLFTLDSQTRLLQSKILLSSRASKSSRVFGRANEGFASELHDPWEPESSARPR